MSGGLSEQLGDFIASMRNRGTNPFFFSYILSFLLYNFNAVLYLFVTNSNFNERINMLGELLRYNQDFGEIATFGVPLITALTYTFLWPFFDGWVRIVRERIENNLKITGSKFLNRKTYTAIEYSQLKDEFKVIEEQLNQALDSHD